MAAPMGNQFWKQRSKHGRDKLFTSPELLWEAACEYFQWCDENPWETLQVTDKGKSKEVKESPTQRPYSMSGLCLYLDASEKWWYNFKEALDEEKDKDFLYIISRIECVIETQQFEGATVGAFNANIISRKLGLADKQQQEITGKLTGLQIVVNSHEDGELVKQIESL